MDRSKNLDVSWPKDKIPGTLHERSNDLSVPIIVYEKEKKIMDISRNIKSTWTNSKGSRN